MEDVFEFEPVNAGGVGLLDVVVVGVAVEEVRDADPERAGVAELAEVDAVHHEVLGELEVAADLEHGVDIGENSYLPAKRLIEFEIERRQKQNIRKSLGTSFRTLIFIMIFPKAK